MDPKAKIDFWRNLKKSWKYAEENTPLVALLVTSLGGLLWFLWNDGRFLFWILLVSLFGLVFTLLIWGIVPPPGKWAWFFNVGENNQHGGSWQACREYGFLSAGGGPKWRDAVKRLSIGDPVYAYVSQVGYVGFGEVIKEAVHIKDFTVAPGKKPLLSAGILPENLRKQLQAASDDPDYSDWVVRIKWYKTYSKDEALSGVYVSPQTICKYEKKEVLEALRQGFSG